MPRAVSLRNGRPNQSDLVQMTLPRPMTIPGPDGKLIVVYESQEANRYIEHLQAQLNFWKLHRTAP